MYLQLLRPYILMLASYRSIPYIMGACVFCIVMALYCCTWVAPEDFQQGENSRIIYVHVPSAWMSVFLYVFISILSVAFLLTKHPILHLISQIGCKTGTLFTLLTLLTGSFWGKPMWGAFWVWDARLTSVLILLFLYLGALRVSTMSAEIAAILICIGLINIPIIKFSVNWWNTLHQPSSINQFSASIHISMLLPILLILLTFVLVTLVLILLETRESLLRTYTLSLYKEYDPGCQGALCAL